MTTYARKTQRRAPRFRVESIDVNSCWLGSREYDPGPVYWAPPAGGYVWELLRDGNRRQICYGLELWGSTLIWNPKRDRSLAALIRREARRHFRSLDKYQ